MKLNLIQHHPAEGPGELAQWAAARKIELIVHRADLGQLPPAGATPLVVLGGPYSAVYGPDWLQREQRWLQTVIAQGTPVVAICLGAQLLARALGATLTRMPATESGWTSIQFDGGTTLDVLQWHEDSFNLPPGARLLARSDTCPHQLFSLHGKYLGLQFHPEWNAASVAALNRYFGAASPLPHDVDQARFALASAWLHTLMDDWLQQCRHGTAPA